MNTNFKPGEMVTLKNGLRIGYQYLRSTEHRDVILNVQTGEVKLVYKGKLMRTADAVELVSQVAEAA